MFRGRCFKRVPKCAVAICADHDRSMPADELWEDVIVGVTHTEIAVWAEHDAFAPNDLTVDEAANQRTLRHTNVNKHAPRRSRP